LISDGVGTLYLQNYFILGTGELSLKLVAARKVKAKVDHPCQKNNGGCSHICAAVLKRAVS